MPFYQHNDNSPTDQGCLYVAPSADIIGDVELGPEVSVWHGCVLRADLAPIIVGANSNVQDLTVVHVDKDAPTIIGRDVTIGHRAVLHACRVGDGSLIGMGAIILDHAEIGEGCLIAAGSLIPPRKKIPAGSMVMGVPGKVVRKLSPEEIEGQRRHARGYIELARSYLTP